MTHLSDQYVSTVPSLRRRVRRVARWLLRSGAKALGGPAVAQVPPTLRRDVGLDDNVTAPGALDPPRCWPSWWP